MAPGLALLLLTVAADAAPIPLLDVGTAGFVGQSEFGPLDQPVEVTSYAQFTAAFGASTAGLANPYLAPSVAAFFVNGGQHLYVVRTAGADDASLIGTDGGPGARTGLQALRDADSLGAFAVPGAASLAVQQAMIALAEGTADRIAVLDPVSATDANAVMSQRANLTSTDGWAALYFPYVVGDPTGVSLTLPPSGWAAGVLAKSAPNVSPTGALANASNLSTPVSSTLQGTLNPLGIDCLRYFTSTGVQLFGARTIADNTDWTYLAVRRLGIAIRRSVLAGTAWCLQQPNDASLWTQLTNDVSDFLYARWIDGWFAGSSPSQAFFVRCDATTMTATDVAEGRTVILVGFAPLQAGNFVLLRLVQQRPPTAGVAAVSGPAGALGAAPNPCRAGTTLTFALARPGAASLAVVDAAGRVVRRLPSAARAAGPQSVAWDGRDDAGVPVPPGVYLAELRAGGLVRTRRLAVVR